MDRKKTIVIDLDGCLTDGKLNITSDGSKLFKSFHSRDVAAIRELIFNGWRVVIVSADDDPSGQHFADKVGAEFLHLRDKSAIPFEYTAAVGDSAWDIPMLKKAGISMCPANATNPVRKVCAVRLLTAGGNGIMEEVSQVIDSTERALSSTGRTIGNYAKAFMIILLLWSMSSCQADRRIMKGMIIKYQVTYHNNVWELVDASPLSKLTEKGCMVDQGKVLRCYVRSIVPFPVKDY